MKVVVSHPGIQHAFQLAWALEEYGHLAHLYSGIPVLSNEEGNPAPRSARYSRSAPIPAHKRSHFRWVPVAQRLAARLLPERHARAVIHRVDHLFDAWTARAVGQQAVDVVVCYENAALRTFREARAIGAVTVLDAAALHYRTAEKWRASDPPWVDAQKEEEVRLADAILTCSRLAADSYEAAGVPKEKVHVVPLGANLPSGGAATARRQPGALRLVFVGTLRRLKGCDILLDAFEQIRSRAGHATLTLIGAPVEQDLLERARRMPGVRCLPFLPQDAMLEEVAGHDVLVLPSRMDSFGMVVPEAMALGLPVIVSENVGSRMIIEQHPDAGWIVPCTVEGLLRQALELAGRPEGLGQASSAARRAAEEFTWGKYRRRVVSTIEAIYAEAKQRASSRPAND